MKLVTFSLNKFNESRNLRYCTTRFVRRGGAPNMSAIVDSFFVFVEKFDCTKFLLEPRDGGEYFKFLEEIAFENSNIYELTEEEIKGYTGRYAKYFD